LCVVLSVSPVVSALRHKRGIKTVFFSRQQRQFSALIRRARVRVTSHTPQRRAAASFHEDDLSLIERILGHRHRAPTPTPTMQQQEEATRPNQECLILTIRTTSNMIVQTTYLLSLHQPPRRFATQGLPPLWRCWGELLLSLSSCVAFEDFD